MFYCGVFLECMRFDLQRAANQLIGELLLMIMIGEIFDVCHEHRVERKMEELFVTTWHRYM